MPEWCDRGALLGLIAVTALATYLLRAVPLVLLRRPLRNPHFVALLEYMPYGVLAAMTFPAVFTSAGGLIPSLAGMTVAMILAYRRKGLLTVAIGAVAMAAIVTLIL